MFKTKIAVSFLKNFERIMRIELTSLPWQGNALTVVLNPHFFLGDKGTRTVYKILRKSMI